MTWMEFKDLPKEKQQAFIDEMCKTSLVTRVGLAKYFNVDRGTVTRLLRDRELTVHTRQSAPLTIPEKIQTIATQNIHVEQNPHTTIAPSDTLKKLFVESGTSNYNRTTTEYSLRLALEEERKSNIDICQFRSKNYDNVFASNFGTGVATNQRALEVFKRYTLFCKTLGVETSDDIQTYVPDVARKIRDQMVSSPLHLALKLDTAFGTATKDSPRCIYHCLMWLAYAGAPRNALPFITVEDVDLNKLHVSIDNKLYPLYKEGIMAFESACTSTQFMVPTAYSSYAKTRAPGNRILRGYKNDSINIISMLRNANDYATQRGVSLGYTALKQSGAFYRIYELERAGFEPDFANIVADRIAHGATRVSVSVIKRDYDAWKKAFN